MIPLLAALLLPLTPQESLEALGYTVDYLKAPEGALLEVGGLDFLPDGRLVVTTRRGQVWLVENPLAADPADAHFSLFAEGLWEGLGLAIVEGEIHVMQRGELSHLVDVDGDGRCDRIETLCDDWGLSGNYHEFGYGLPVDDQGNHYISLNVSFFSPKWWHGKSPVPYRGWTLRVTPQGVLEPVASGFRSPAGICLSPQGELFVTDNQGDWMAASPIFQVVPGGFHGHPASLDWTDEYRATSTKASDTIPPARAVERVPPAIWLPYKWSRSPGDMAWDTTGGRFGPFDGQFFLAELTNGMVLRGDFQEVGGRKQGWVIPFRQRVGSTVRLRFAPDGSLFAGMTNRGWGGLSPADGIARLRWTGELPMEVHGVRLEGSGRFVVTFTRPLASDLDAIAGSLRVTQYDYDYWWEYGSPERHVTERAVRAIQLADGNHTLSFEVEGLEAGMMARVRMPGLAAADGTPLVHDEFAYTITRLPSAPDRPEHVAKLVPPPPARETGDEGWLFLTWGDALGRWNSTGWQLCEAELDPEDRTHFRTREGNGALVNVGPDASDFVSREVFGDCKIHLRFQVPEQGDSGVFLMGRYEVQLADSSGKEKDLRPGDCGGLSAGDGFAGRGPDLNALREPGQWHDLDVEFQAPRFDAQGKKIANARFLRVRIEDVLLHENVEVPGPTAGALAEDEVPFGPLMIQGGHTQVAIGDVRVFPKVPRTEPEGWEPLFDGESLDGWKISDDGDWTVEDDVIQGQGKPSHLFSPRGDYKNFEVRGRFKISDGGNSGLYFRTTFGPGWPQGYEAQINSTYTDPQKVGSLYAIVPNATTLVPPDTWFDYFVRCVDEAEGVRIVIQVNGVTVVDHLDRERRHAQGHIAIQQHHEGSVIEVKDLWIREL
jgi:glucose/arabinose dehydrogenase